MNDKPDLSSLISLISNSNINPEELLSSFINSSSNNDNQTQNNSSEEKNTPSENIPDMKTIMKIMEIFKSSNQDNPSKDLLKSLKPFLNDSRKEKVDQYISILGISKVLEIFNNLNKD